MDFEIYFNKLGNNDYTYGRIAIDKYKRYIRNNMRSTSQKIKYDILNEFAAENICKEYNCEELIDLYISGLYYDKSRHKITSSTLTKVPYESLEFTLETLLKYIEFGVQEMYKMNAPTIVPAMKQIEKYIDDTYKFLQTLKK